MRSNTSAGSGRLRNPLGGYEGGFIGGGINTFGSNDGIADGTPNARGHVQRQLIVNGEVLARYGDAPQLEQPQSANNTHLKFNANTAEFHLGAFPVGLGGQAGGAGGGAASSALAARSVPSTAQMRFAVAVQYAFFDGLTGSQRKFVGLPGWLQLVSARKLLGF